MTRVIKASALTDATKSHVGRLVSHAGATTPERLESAYSLRENVVLIFRREYDGHRWRPHERRRRGALLPSGDRDVCGVFAGTDEQPSGCTSRATRWG